MSTTQEGQITKSKSGKDAYVILSGVEYTLSGDTFHYRAALKAAGWKYNADRKAWTIKSDKSLILPREGCSLTRANGTVCIYDKRKPERTEVRSSGHGPGCRCRDCFDNYDM